MRNAAVVCLCSLNYAFGAGQPTEPWQRKMADAREQLSHADYGEAAETLRQALAVAETFDPGDPRRWVTRDTLASADQTLARLDDAEFQLRAALGEVRTAIGRDNGAYATIEVHLASVLRVRGRLHQAETLLRDSLSRQERFFSADSDRIAGARNLLAEILINQQRYPEAEAALNLALPVSERQAKQDMTAIVLNNLAVIRHLQRRDTEARQILERALELLRHEIAPCYPLLGRTYHNLATIDFITGRREEAGPFYRQALESLQRLGRSHPVYLAVLTDYALFLHAPVTRQRPARSKRKLEPQAPNLLLSRLAL